MPLFTVEATYRLPIYRHRTYSADTPEAACRLAVEDEDWDKGKEDYETSGETYITGIWDGDESAYLGDAIPVPPHFDETVQRKADHFEILLGLLKIMAADAEAARPTVPQWLAKAGWAIALAEAIIDGARGPDADADLPAIADATANANSPSHLETALCVWEAMLNFRIDHAGDLNSTDNIDAMVRVWDELGSVRMRQFATQIADFAIDVHADLKAQVEVDQWAYDFEFIPAVVENLDWSIDGPERTQEPEVFLQTVLDRLRTIGTT